MLGQHAHLGASRCNLNVKASLLYRIVHGYGVLGQHAHLGASRCNLNVKRLFDAKHRASVYSACISWCKQMTPERKASLLQRIVYVCGVLSEHAHLDASRCNTNVKHLFDDGCMGVVNMYVLVLTDASRFLRLT